VRRSSASLTLMRKRPTEAEAQALPAMSESTSGRPQQWSPGSRLRRMGRLDGWISRSKRAHRRILDVSVDGPEGAVPLLFHNGTLSSGQLYDPFVEAASQHSLRMVSFSRAGYGNSTRNPGRRVASIIPDVAAILDHLGAHRYYTLGWSGGGPHALACAALLPARLIGAATVGCLAPYEAEGLNWMAGMGQENVESGRAALAGDTALRTFLERAASWAANATPDEVAASLGDLVSDADVRRSVASRRPGWQMSSGNLCATESGVGMTMRSPL